MGVYKILKVKGGTAREDEPALCLSCQSATIAHGVRLDETAIYCSEFGRHTPRFAVRTCSRYINANHPSLMAMQSIAWVLRTDQSRRQIGFVAPARQKPADRDHFYED